MSYFSSKTIAIRPLFSTNLRLFTLPCRPTVSYRLKPDGTSTDVQMLQICSFNLIGLCKKDVTGGKTNDEESNDVSRFRHSKLRSS